MSPPPADNSITAAVVFATQESKESESVPLQAAGLPSILIAENTGARLDNEANTLQDLEDDSKEENAPAYESSVSSSSQPNGKVYSGLSLAPMDDLVRTVNEHLKDCRFCKGSSLELKMDRQIGLAANYKLVCESCDSKDASLRQHIYYLKRKFNDSTSPKMRHKLSQEVSRQKSKLKKSKKRRQQDDTYHHLLLVLKKQRERNKGKQWITQLMSEL